MSRSATEGRTYTLRNAASIVFALTAVLPLLLFTYTLYSLSQLSRTEAQLGLGAALGCALVGLFIFSNLMARLSEVLRFLEAHGAKEPAGPEVSATAAVAAEPDLHRARTGPDGADDEGSFTDSAPASSIPMATPGTIVVPGLGTITAARRAASAARHAAGVFDEVQKTMWQAEAQRHLGRRVLVSVKNAAEPVVGSLAQIAEDGVLLEQGDQRVAVSYLRITNIESDTSHSG